MSVNVVFTTFIFDLCISKRSNQLHLTWKEPYGGGARHGISPIGAKPPQNVASPWNKLVKNQEANCREIFKFWSNRDLSCSCSQNLQTMCDGDGGHTYIAARWGRIEREICSSSLSFNSVCHIVMITTPLLRRNHQSPTPTQNRTRNRTQTAARCLGRDLTWHVV